MLPQVSHRAFTNAETKPVGRLHCLPHQAITQLNGDKQPMKQVNENIRPPEYGTLRDPWPDALLDGKLWQLDEADWEARQNLTLCGERHPCRRRQAGHQGHRGRPGRDPVRPGRGNVRPTERGRPQGPGPPGQVGRCEEACGRLTHDRSGGLPTTHVH